ncbi:sulfotransferase domain-containing protein [Thalassospira povalilytica]|uniref:Sulfotransferase domain-containing protein n=1 Tax=Thalassospira povalilytica TaxID=732237 RepID=A0A8I1M9M3_9PROT|nr:sulfotransferase domain-containing protein [Thalassospira povalilytica]MBN8197314.1 sulfotransferase domain-containing protein [Thalassospira povalilytica]
MDFLAGIKGFFMGSNFRKVMDAGRAYMIGLRHNLRNQPHLSTLPSSPRIDDTFLVEFPKSGITWLTFLIASVNLQKSGIERQPTFFAINDLVPDIHVSRHLPPPLPFPDMRFIKSHAGYNPLYSKVIYLVRDPRDVMVSYYAFARKLGWYNGSLHDMIKDPQFGIKAWVAHANSWLDETKPSVSFNVIRYEDLQANAGGVLKRIYSLLGYSIEDEIIGRAVDLASFSAMKENEAFCSENNPTLPADFKFVREGGSSYKAEISKEDIDFIEKVAGETMSAFGYI